MSTPVEPVLASPPDPEPIFLMARSDSGGDRRFVRAGAASVVLHAAAIALLSFAPWSEFAGNEGRRKPLELHQSATLVAPPPELTQKAPNKGKVSKEFDIESLKPRPRLHLPPVAVPGPPPSQRGPLVPPPPALPAPAEIEAPKLAQTSPPLGSPLAPAPPQIQTDEKPKLAFERPGSSEGTGKAPAGGVPRPATSVDEAVRAVARGGRGGIVVGDVTEGAGGVGAGLNIPPSPGRTGSSLELLSDPMGVDFRPYLIRILATVRRNWFSVIPESVRLGSRGRVQIQFAINRDGGVPKLVIAMPSGLEALDRAAVAGISASNPFPPLPAEFRGNQVRLQFTFLYNAQR